MAPSVRPLPRRIKSPPPLTAFQRVCVEIGMELGCKPETVKDNLTRGFGWHHKVAVANTILIRHRLYEKVADVMAEVDASMLPGEVELADALLASAIADAEEDVAEANYRHTPTAATAHALIKKSAGDILRLEQRNRELARQWGL